MLLLAVMHWLLVLWANTRLAEGKAVCTSGMLGMPKHQDCLTMYHKLPYANSEPGGDLTAPRIFVEPQSLFNPFGNVINPYPGNSMVPLPKIWRWSKSLAGIVDR